MTFSTVKRKFRKLCLIWVFYRVRNKLFTSRDTANLKLVWLSEATCYSWLAEWKRGPLPWLAIIMGISRQQGRLKVVILLHVILWRCLKFHLLLPEAFVKKKKIAQIKFCLYPWNMKDGFTSVASLVVSAYRIFHPDWSPLFYFSNYSLSVILFTSSGCDQTAQHYSQYHC